MKDKNKELVIVVALPGKAPEARSIPREGALKEIANLVGGNLLALPLGDIDVVCAETPTEEHAYNRSLPALGPLLGPLVAVGGPDSRGAPTSLLGKQVQRALNLFYYC